MGRAAPTILQIIPRLDTGGAELSTIEIVEAVVAAGGRALVATEGGRMADRVIEAGGELRVISASTKNPLRMLANVVRLRTIIDEDRVDLIHARSRAPAWSARLAARLARIPFVTTYHGAYAEHGPFKRLYNSVMASADRVIANSGYTARLIQSRYATESARIRVIHRGVDMRTFDPGAVSAERLERLRSAWGIGGDQRVVLQAARLTSWKGQGTLIEAAAQLARAGELGSVVFVFAGDDQGRVGYREELLRKAAASGLSEAVRFPGHVDDVAAAFALAHVAVVASIEPEAFGRAATEAQAMGCPVIATDIGAPPETVIPAGSDELGAGTGWLVPPSDAVALAGALRRALALEAGERTDLGGRARAHVAASFTLETMKRATLEVYDELLAGRFAAAASGTSNAT
ncbi:MAG: glycosyltransferase family 4 protein [Hyphomicrobiaceae bacterium]